jgi:hypothetical protein
LPPPERPASRRAETGRFPSSGNHGQRRAPGRARRGHQTHGGGEQSAPSRRARSPELDGRCRGQNLPILYPAQHPAGLLLLVIQMMPAGEFAQVPGRETGSQMEDDAAARALSSATRCGCLLH